MHIQCQKYLSGMAYSVFKELPVRGFVLSSNPYTNTDLKGHFAGIQFSKEFLKFFIPNFPIGDGDYLCVLSLLESEKGYFDKVFLEKNFKKILQPPNSELLSAIGRLIFRLCIC